MFCWETKWTTFCRGWELLLYFICFRFPVFVHTEQGHKGNIERFVLVDAIFQVLENEKGKINHFFIFFCWGNLSVTEFRNRTRL